MRFRVVRETAQLWPAQTQYIATLTVLRSSLLRVQALDPLSSVFRHDLDTRYRYGVHPQREAHPNFLFSRCLTSPSDRTENSHPTSHPTRPTQLTTTITTTA